MLHAEVPLEYLTISEAVDWENYDQLWIFLRNSPALRDKKLPARSDIRAWEAALKGFQVGYHSVVMSGSLRLQESSEPKPLFQFRLKPLKLDFSNRLERRFGADRFLDIDFPEIDEKKAHGSLGTICEWLVDGKHNFFNRIWKPFFVKRDRPSLKSQLDAVNLSQQDTDKGTTSKLYFLAVEESGYQLYRMPGIPPRREGCELLSSMTVSTLLNWVRPTEENKKQSFLKLFSRTALGELSSSNLL
jgi:hypothetical protein